MPKLFLPTLLLTLLLGAIGFQLPETSPWSLWCDIGAMLAGGTSLGLLAIGKRIRFDPVLR